MRQLLNTRDLNGRYSLAGLALAMVVLLSGCWPFHKSSPPPPPSLTCSGQPPTVAPGDSVNLTLKRNGFKSNHPCSYAWTSDAGRVANSSSSAATLDTVGVADGDYTAQVTVTDLKNHSTASRSANFAVKVPPPSVSCSANSSNVEPGTPSTITLTTKTFGDVPISNYKYQTSAGAIGGATPTVTLDQRKLQHGD